MVAVNIDDVNRKFGKSYMEIKAIGNSTCNLKRKSNIFYKARKAKLSEIIARNFKPVSKKKQLEKKIILFRYSNQNSSLFVKF